VLATIVALTIVVGPTTEEGRLVYAVQNDYLTYENAKHKVKVQYPSDWLPTDDNRIPGGYFYDTDDVVVEFLAANQSVYFRQDDQKTHTSLALIVAEYENNNSRTTSEQLSEFGKSECLLLGKAVLTFKFCIGITM
jgi:hypothetical protein